MNVRKDAIRRKQFTKKPAHTSCKCEANFDVTAPHSMRIFRESWAHSNPCKKTLQIIGYKLICDFTICFASPGCDFTICFASAGSMNRAFEMGKKTNSLCPTEFPAIPARFYRFESRSRSWVFFSPKIELKFTSSRCPLSIVHCSFVPL